MACCGPPRTSTRARRNGARPPPGPAAISPAPARTRGPVVAMTYGGAHRLSVRGPVTGRVYVFPSDGRPIAVDSRDARLMQGVPGLRPAS
jgi:hypothetical protein